MLTEALVSTLVLLLTEAAVTIVVGFSAVMVLTTKAQVTIFELILTEVPAE
jgi:hypothetical protein